MDLGELGELSFSAAMRTSFGIASIRPAPKRGGGFRLRKSHPVLGRKTGWRLFASG